MNPVTIVIYTAPNGRAPFLTWRDNLDTKARAIIKTRLDRLLDLKHYGDCKRLKNCNNIWELRVAYGPGYRIYFAKDNEIIIIMLMGGDKGTQKSDIEKAKRYWKDYQEVKNG